MPYANTLSGTYRKNPLLLVNRLPRGTTYYVDTNSGSNSNNGKSWASAFLTMAQAFSVLASGDRIVFVGNIREQLTTPVQVFDVQIIGAGNRPRHADTTPAGGELAGSTWKNPASPSTTTPHLKIIQQGWRLENILFAGPSAAACVQLFRDGGATNAERDASHAEIIGCRFASGQDGVEQSGGCYNVRIEGCSFHDLTGYAIKHTAGAGIAAPYRWEIRNNRFGGCANIMGAWAARQFQIHDNDFKETTTNYFDFSTGSHNSVLRNSFDVAAADFDPVGHVTGSTTDNWSNYLIDAIETGLPAN